MMSDSVGLPLFLLTANLFNFVVAKRCESEDGRSSKMCDDDEECCERDGEARCCTDLGIGGVIGIVIVIAIIIAIACFCCYCWWKTSCNNGDCNSSFNDDCFQGTRSPSVTGTVRTVTALQPSSGVVRFVRMETFNQPSSDNSHSNTNNTEPPPAEPPPAEPPPTEPPPPYSNTDAPPSYSEIDV